MLPRAGGRAPLPEAAAIAHVIDTRRPDLVASLHNCDTGGAFLLAAQGHPLLAPVLTRAANRSRIPIADHPSDALDWPSSGHGTFTIPPPDQIRPAPPGTSSIHYAHELGARYALMPEVPMWASRPHALPADQAARQLEDAAAILTRLTQQAELPTDGPFGAALADALRGMPLTAGVYRAHPDAGAGQDLAYLLPLRASGMLLRTLDPLLASGAGRLDAVRALTEEYFRQWLDAAEAALCPEPLPLHRTAGLQLDVILGALALLGEQGPQQALAAETGATRHHPVAHAPAVPANALASSAPLSPSPEEHPVTHSGTDYNRPGQRRIGCLALIRNTGGDVLLVKPSYKEGHILVGGGAQPDEEPHHAAYREAVEETGLTQLTIDGLLLVDYIPANPTSGSVEGYNLVFDAGEITDDAAITLPAGLPGQQPELTDWVFCPPDQLDTYCEPYQARRITQALAALDYPSRRGLCIEGFPANVN
jgi:8-oxo-dGTP pyrophosphatase MutT (NUDIX family)